MSRITEMSEAYIKKTKQSEGFESRPYPDPGSGGKPYTIGYGTTKYFDTGKLVTMQDKPIDEKEADRLLRGWYRTKVSPLVVKLCRADLNANEFDAIGDFIYNAGATYRDKQGVIRYFNLFANVNAKMPKEKMIPYWTTLCITGSGVRLGGLVTRRKEEVTLYFKPI